MKKIALCVVIALTALGPAALAQDNAARARAIEKTLKANDAKRQLKERINGGHYVQQDWSAEGHKVSVSIYEYSSAEEAARIMAMMEKGVAAAEVSERLKGIGDDGIYTSNKRGTNTSLAFRTGHVLVTIDGTSLKVVRKFAREIADQLGRK